MIDRENPSVGNSTISRRALLLAAGASILAACSDGKTDSPQIPDTTTSTTLIIPETTSTTAPETTLSVEFTGAATELLRVTTLPALDAAFEKAYSGKVTSPSADTSFTIERNAEVREGGDTYESVLVDTGTTALEMGRTVDGKTGQPTDVFARFYVPGERLAADERESWTNSDNPDGNAYGDEIRLSTVPTQEGLRYDAFGSLSDGYFSTQGDLSPYMQEQYGDPRAAAEKAQQVAESVAAFIG